MDFTNSLAPVAFCLGVCYPLFMERHPSGRPFHKRVRLGPCTRLLCDPSRRAYALGLVGDIDRGMIEEEITIRIARHVNDPQAEAGVVEVARSPRAAPGIGCAAQAVGGFGGAQDRGGSGCCPGDTAVPRELHA